MITSHSSPWSIKPLLSVSFLLIVIAVTQTDAKKKVELRKWESTGIVNCTDVKEFACKNDSKTLLPHRQRCDGIPQCKDKSDEYNCTECKSVFSITRDDGTLECITAAGLRQEKTERENAAYYARQPLWYRKMYYPSHETTTEERMYPLCTVSKREKLWDNWEDNCASDEVRCSRETMCIPAKSVCNGVEDCTGYYYDSRYDYDEGRYHKVFIGLDDEKNCTECKNGAVMCETDKKCIASVSLCDGSKDCSDGSDEKNCTTATCAGPDRALCANGICIDSDRVCDGKIDCEDASDEQNCPTSCGVAVTNATKLPKIVTCGSKRYLKSEVCSGLVPDNGCYYECDRSDCDCNTSIYCNGKCISKERVCDGKRDCYNGDDEKNCLKACAKYPHFSCFNKLVLKCLTPEHRCDGVRDCADGSDEKKCDKCPSDAHKCDGGCLPASKRCDGVKDCKDGSDEKNCSCEDCTSNRLDTYSCESSGTCLKRSAACGPHSLCPNPTARDELFCVRQSRRKGPEGTSKKEDTSRFWD